MDQACHQGEEMSEDKESTYVTDPKILDAINQYEENKEPAVYTIHLLNKTVADLEVVSGGVGMWGGSVGEESHRGPEQSRVE